MSASVPKLVGRVMVGWKEKDGAEVSQNGQFGGLLRGAAAETDRRAMYSQNKSAREENDVMLSE